jgi:hypothetical protein
VLKSIAKIAVILILLVLGYKVAQGYFTYRWATYVAECADKLELCSLGRQKASDQLVSEAVDKLYSCVKERQPFVESFLVPLPKSHAATSSDPIDYKYAEDFCRLPK